MADSIPVTDSIRGFSELIYAETAAAIQQMMSIDELPAALELQTVRICCGSKTVNEIDNGYAMPAGTPWLAELWFGKNMKGIDNSDTFHTPNPVLARLPCKTIQGVGDSWASILSDFGINTIEQLAHCSHKKTLRIISEAGSHKIVDFVSKAQSVIEPPPPVPRTALDEIKLSEAILITDGEISGIEVSDWNHVITFLFKLYSALDDAAIKTLTLRDALG
ncbi:hypothetical protein P4C99_02475 [Pontiellaceae bacterium B1224]|nr:hypothetical protein [Pontiellaceae bacterium B1224]